MKCPKCKAENPDTVKFCGECGTRLPSLEDVEVTETMEAPKEELTRGTTFANRYEIIEELGKGGMGRVYRVEDKKLEQEVALKLIKPEIAKDKKTIERFRNELKLARDIRHKNVCGMFDLGEIEGAHFITMEYVRGEDLRSLIRRIGQLPIGKSISIVKQICEGLSEAHRLGVVHRDLKSNNIMIDKEGNVRIMDFGIARSLEAKGITGAGVMIGTPEYMSPEQVEGKETDQRSDIYSLGIILYEMLVGKVPFEGDSALAVAVKHKTETPKAPTEYNDQIPENLSRIILKCLEKDKELRYQRVDDMTSELMNIEKGVVTTKSMTPERKPLTSREITVRFSAKKMFFPAAVVVLILIAALIIWKLLPKKETGLIPSDKPSLAVMYFENNTGEEGLDHWRKALSDLLISDLSQSKYINVLSSDRLFSILRRLDLLEARSYATEDLQEVAFQGQASHLLQGALTKAGENFRINISIQDASSGKLVGSETAEGRGQESFHLMVDELTPKIKANFKLNAKEIAGDIDKDIGKIMTSSPEAYKYFVDGRKYHRPGQYDLELEFMKKAVNIDPEFAMAYRAMAAAYKNKRNTPEAKKCIQKALEFSDRLPDRDRYLIEADSYNLEGNDEKAIETYSKLLALYPDDHAGNNNLGAKYEMLEDVDNAIKYYELAHKSEKTMVTLTNLADCYDRKGLHNKSRELYLDYLDNVSKEAQIHMRLAINYLIGLEFDLALEEADKAIALNPNYNKNFIYFLKGDFDFFEKTCLDLLKEENKRRHIGARVRLEMLYRTQGKFQEAIRQAQSAVAIAEDLKNPNWLCRFRLILGNSYIKTGQLQDALREIDLALDHAGEEQIRDFKIWGLFLKAVVLSQMKSFDEAEKASELLKSVIEEGEIKKEIRLYYLISGLIELEKKNLMEALGLLQEALRLLPYQSTASYDQALYLYPFADALYANKDTERAQEEFEKITRLTLGRQDYGDLYAKSFYMLGKIYEERGDSAKSIEHYEKFLDLWKDADSGLPEVEDARKRLAGLKVQ